MIKIALLGYGKMGKIIEEIATKKGYTIVTKIDGFEDKIEFNNADVAIDFSTPQAAIHNIHQALIQNIPIVSGTTGWLEKYDEIVDLVHQHNGTFLYASNFSLGVNLFFALNKYLANLMKDYNYEVSITETHHTQKLDAPSGTAISLANQILPFLNKQNWTLNKENKEDLLINALRIENVPGTHQISYQSDIDTIDIIHTAHNRVGFAQGAVLAATYLVGKKGIFTMEDVLGLKKNNFIK